MFTEQTRMSDNKIVSAVVICLVLYLAKKMEKITTTPISPIKLVRAKVI
jgi:hypothetical protein